MPFVYLLLSLKDNKQYIGSTHNLGKRLSLHNNGNVISTKHRRPFILKDYQELKTIQEASVFEKKYKRSHGALDRAIKSGIFVIIDKLNSE